MKYFVTVGGSTVEVELGSGGITVDGVEVSGALAHLEGTHLRSLLLDGASHPILAHRRDGGTWDLHIRGRRLTAEAIDERTHTIRAMTGEGAGPSGPRPIRAPMPGLVVKVEVGVGDRVEAGQGVVIMEAMKMENELKAETAGVVALIHVAPGQAVEKDQVLIDLEAPDDGHGGEP
jgi:pyruvate carboxylase subunit B